ncbi:MAG: rhomboid family intramembrane serine protease [Acidovorax sp.]|nr:rhomboid family intramembrane serine protease [Acidovorax sp.]
MFYAIPLENRPTWRNPPWMTVALILVNMLVFWGPQRSEEKAQDRAAQFYMDSQLPALEIPGFVDWLKKTGSPRAKHAQAAYQRGDHGLLLQAMEHEPVFLALLKADRIVEPGQPMHAVWQTQRRQYEALQPPPFTRRWAQDYEKDAEFRPVTWLTATFLHGSTGHLLGNMLFLFLFGFSVELALGRGTYLAFYLLGAVGGSLLAGWAYAGHGSHGLGASGAVSALMGMYAVMYRLRRIRFFYQLFFYFNYVTAPALILLPAWIANELLQHFTSGQPVAYMAHLGGLLTGAVLMAVALQVRQVRLPEPEVDEGAGLFDGHVARARRLSETMQFDQAVVEWRAAARLRPDDADTLRAWFGVARLLPASEDFHRAAHRIFRLNANDGVTLELQHSSYKTYLDLAKPGARLKPEDMARLVRRFARARYFHDAQKLCLALLKTAPQHPGLGDTVSILANGLLQSGQREDAAGWLPHLERLAQQDAVTRALQSG